MVVSTEHYIRLRYCCRVSYPPPLAPAPGTAQKGQQLFTKKVSKLTHVVVVIMPPEHCINLRYLLRQQHVIRLPHVRQCDYQICTSCLHGMTQHSTA